VVTRSTGLVAGALALVGACWLAFACAPASSGAIVPKGEGVPPPHTADGRVVGADNKSPQQLLSEQGTTAHAAPGWKVDKKGVSYDPKRAPGGPDQGATRLETADGGTETVPAH
jgi:hypothetical protein